MKKQKKYYTIDPPEGWKYGFPKRVDKVEIDIVKQSLELGYPQSLIDKYGKSFHVSVNIIYEN